MGLLVARMLSYSAMIIISLIKVKMWKNRAIKRILKAFSCWMAFSYNAFMAVELESKVQLLG
jgi:hypothetical protein